MRARPELAGTLLAKGTWDYAIVDQLTPQSGDIVIPKTRYSGFFNTNIDSVLRAAASAIWSLRALPPMSASGRRCATRFISNISAS
jgi:hypothetical protein